MDWISQNIGSLVVLSAVLLLAAALVRSLIKAKRSGKSHCAGCQSCALSGKCSGSCGADFKKNSK